MSHNILNIYSFADYEEIDTFSNLNAPSYTFLPDAFQQTLPPTRKNHPQNNQFLNSVALTQFANLPNNIHQQLFINTIPAWKPSRRLQKKNCRHRMHQLFVRKSPIIIGLCFAILSLKTFLARICTSIYKNGFPSYTPRTIWEKHI